MVNVLELDRYLQENPATIEFILEGIGCPNVKTNYRNHEIRCSREEGGNPSSVLVDTSTLHFKCFSTEEKGTLYNLVMIKLDISFKDSLCWINDFLGLEFDNSNFVPTRINYPFGGFYKNLICNEDEYVELKVKTYDETILEEFCPACNIKFLKDGIDFMTQNKFNLGYDREHDKIVIPQWSPQGDLVGIMGRSNDPSVPHGLRWLPIISCQRQYTLFGYHQNYTEIQNKQLCVITESEKGVMQLASMGYNYGLATCKNNVSPTQARYIKSLGVDKVILAYDHGQEEEYIRQQAEKLKISNQICSNKVGYIFDKDGEILKDKESPTDLGSSVFKELGNRYVTWI